MRSQSTTIARHTVQRGLVTVEFAIVGLLFFTLLFGAIETGRLMFTWNIAAEAARLGARTAAVCDPTSADVLNAVKLNSSSLLPATVVAQTKCYGDDGGEVACNSDEVAFVEVRLQYQHNFLVPGLNSVITLPLQEVSVMRPREALGVVRGSDQPAC